MDAICIHHGKCGMVDARENIRFFTVIHKRFVSESQIIVEELGGPSDVSGWVVIDLLIATRNNL